MRIKKPKRVSEASIVIFGPDSGFDSSIPNQAIAVAKEDCAYHRARVCKIEYTGLVVITEFPDLQTIGTFSCLKTCGRIVESAAKHTTHLLEKEFEGQPVHISTTCIID